MLRQDVTVVPFTDEFGTLTTQGMPQKLKARSSELPAEGSKSASGMILPRKPIGRHRAPRRGRSQLMPASVLAEGIHGHRFVLKVAGLRTG